MVNFIGPRKRLSAALHNAPTSFDNYQGIIIGTPPFPTGNNFVCGHAEQNGQGMPTYTAAEICHFFFFRTRPGNGAQWLYEQFAKYGYPESGDPFYFEPRRPDDRGTQHWTLADVERMIRFLSRVGAIDGDRFYISTWLVLWTAKGYGIYA